MSSWSDIVVLTHRTAVEPVELLGFHMCGFLPIIAPTDHKACIWDEMQNGKVVLAVTDGNGDVRFNEASG